MKPVIKKVIKNLSIAMACVTVLSSSVYFCSELKYQDYSTKAQTVDLQESLGAVADYRMKSKARLQHNNDEPIYITIDESFTDEQKNTIISALDNIFGVVGDINSKYQYKIVDEINSFSSKTSISFGIKDAKRVDEMDPVIAITITDKSGLLFGSKGTFFEGCDIYYNPHALERFPELVYESTLHELLHVFGIGDVYKQEQTYGNTFVNTYNGTGEWLHMITPNDYKLLASMYAEDMSDMTENESKKYVDELNKKIDDYSEKYYSYYKSAHEKYWIKKGYSDENVKCYTSNGEISKNVDIMFYRNLHGLGEIAKVRIKVVGDKYVIATYDENDEMIEHCSGKAYHLGDQIFLQEVHLNKLNNGEKTFTDLRIFVSFYSSEQPMYGLEESLTTYRYCQSGVEMEYYNQQNQEMVK